MRKLENAVVQLIENHSEDNILVIGQYLTQLEKIARILGAPLITGKTPNAAREVIYDDFRKGKLHVIVVSKVANFAMRRQQFLAEQGYRYTVQHWENPGGKL